MQCRFLFWAVALLELANGAAIFDQAKGSGRTAGDFNFDPLGTVRHTCYVPMCLTIKIVHICTHSLFFSPFLSSFFSHSLFTTGFGKDANSLKRYRTNEVKNGRLAMLAISGVLTQAALFPEKTFPFL